MYGFMFSFYFSLPLSLPSLPYFLPYSLPYFLSGDPFAGSDPFGSDPFSTAATPNRTTATTMVCVCVGGKREAYAYVLAPYTCCARASVHMFMCVNWFAMLKTTCTCVSVYKSHVCACMTLHVCAGFICVYVKVHLCLCNLPRPYMCCIFFPHMLVYLE